MDKTEFGYNSNVKHEWVKYTCISEEHEDTKQFKIYQKNYA